MTDDDPHFQMMLIFGEHGLTPDPELMARALVDFGPGFDELFAKSLDGAREMKERLVVNGPDDLPIIATVVTDTGSVAMPVNDMADHMHIPPSEAIALNLAIMRQTLGDPIAVLTLVEVDWYVESEIGEALFVSVATRDRCLSGWMPFHYGDGTVTWDQPSRFEARDWPDGPGQPDPITEAISVAFRQATEP